MGAQGQTVVNFGAFPGTSDASVLVLGQTGIGQGSAIEAWVLPQATADHSADEHIVNPPRVYAANIVPGTGFTIYAVNDDRVDGSEAPPGAAVGDTIGGVGFANPVIGNSETYGQWTVAWTWN